MQNQIIKHIIYDNSTDNFLLINPTKQQIFFIPKEESQMFPNRSTGFAGTRPAGYTNDPFNESEDRNFLVNSEGYVNSSWAETNYAGMSIYNVPYIIDDAFVDIKVYNMATDEFMDIDTENLFRLIDIGSQKFKISKNLFNVELTDPTAIEENDGDTIKRNYGSYLFKITPKYVRTSIIEIVDKAHYPYNKKADNYPSIFDPDTPMRPNNRRRNIYNCAKSDFVGTPWAFENNKRQSGRLMGSVVEIWNSSETQLKQIKVISESNLFGELLVGESGVQIGGNYYGYGVCQLVFHPDHFGYDAPYQEINTGDILRIYPRETYFNNISIDLEYKSDNTSLENAFMFLMNDAVRDMKTGIYEVYDKDGVVVDNNGNLDGNVLQSYQIHQMGQYEIRKKIKIN